MKNTLLAFTLLGILALGGLYWLQKPGDPGTPTPVASPEPSPPAIAVPPDPVQRTDTAAVDLEIRQGRRVSGPEVMRVRQGDTVRLRLLSDQDVELHLHGYDLHLHLHAGRAREWSFEAKHSGRFEYELHGAAPGAHQALGVIEVLPR